MTQTDNLLRQLYTQLRHSGDSFSLVYFSDHGLAFKERGKAVQYLAHDDKFQQNFQVPFMVLSSDSKAHRIIKARRSANDFLSFFSQWTGISAKEIKNRYRFISEQKAGPVYITNFKLQKWTITIWAAIFFTKIMHVSGKKIRPERRIFHFHRRD